MLVALRKAGVGEQNGEFIRVYAASPSGSVSRRDVGSVMEVLDGSFSGYASAGGLCFQVQTGHLQASPDSARTWTLSNGDIDSWLSTVNAHASCAFSDVATVCVGIKTTADAVFVRDDWDSLPEAERPEEEMLHPLVTHHLAARWHLPVAPAAAKRVLYPYRLESEDRIPVVLADYPRARRDLFKHRERLQNRNGVAEDFADL